jgi:hypothetical protein
MVAVLARRMSDGELRIFVAVSAFLTVITALSDLGLSTGLPPLLAQGLAVRRSSIRLSAWAGVLLSMLVGSALFVVSDQFGPAFAWLVPSFLVGRISTVWAVVASSTDRSGVSPPTNSYKGPFRSGRCSSSRRFRFVLSESVLRSLRSRAQSPSDRVHLTMVVRLAVANFCVTFGSRQELPACRFCTLDLIS